MKNIYKKIVQKYHNIIALLTAGQHKSNLYRSNQPANNPLIVSLDVVYRTNRCCRSYVSKGK